MKNEYLIHLLKENKTVIVPGLGAFVSNESQTMPVLFNEYLKFDDGLVVGYISNQEKISKEDASKKIETFVSGIKSLLDSGRDVVFAQLGKIKKDSNGKLIFTYDSSTQGAKIEEEKKSITPENIVVTPEKIEKPVTPTPPKTETTTPKPETKIPVKENIEKDLKQNQPIEKEKNKNTSTKKEKKPKEKSPKKKKRWVLYIILIILIGGGGTAGFLFKDQILALFNPNPTEKEYISQTETKKPDIIPSDTLVNDSDTTASIESEYVDPVEEKKSNQKKSNTVNSAAQSGNYYVVIGCYSSDFNAENMMLKAESKGLEASNIGTYGGLIYVSVFSSSDLASATNKLNAVKADFPKAWVFNKR